MGLPSLPIAVNLSGLQLRHDQFVDHLVQILHEIGVNPHCLRLELTESTLIQTVESSLNKLDQLKKIGIRFSLDDFGTGYSSLSYLKRFPFDTVKIDRSFVKNVDSAPDSAAITKAIIAIAKHLNLKVIAEGVETEQEFKFLKENGCDQIQGYLIAPPLPEKSLIQFLETREPWRKAGFPLPPPNFEENLRRFYNPSAAGSAQNLPPVEVADLDPHETD